MHIDRMVTSPAERDLHTARMSPTLAAFVRDGSSRLLVREEGSEPARTPHAPVETRAPVTASREFAPLSGKALGDIFYAESVAEAERADEDAPREAKANPYGGMNRAAALEAQRAPKEGGHELAALFAATGDDDAV